MLYNTKTTYGSVARFFHWFMALVILGMFGVAYLMMDLEPGAQKWQLYGLHKATGLTLLMLGVTRLLWRWINPVPQLARTVPKWQRRAAQYNYALLYLLIFAMPLSGFLMSVLGGHEVSYFGLFTIPAFTEKSAAAGLFHEAHEYLSYLLLGSFTLHVSAALYHQFYLKDRVLTRMLWGRKN